MIVARCIITCLLQDRHADTGVLASDNVTKFLFCICTLISYLPPIDLITVIIQFVLLEDEILGSSPVPYLD